MVEINETEKPTETTVTAEEIRKVKRDPKPSKMKGFQNWNTVFLKRFLSCTILAIETSSLGIIPKQLMPCKKSADGSKFIIQM